jgi:hypothetical protein
MTALNHGTMARDTIAALARDSAPHMVIACA